MTIDFLKFLDNHTNFAPMIKAELTLIAYLNFCNPCSSWEGTEIEIWDNFWFFQNPT